MLTSHLILSELARGALAASVFGCLQATVGIVAVARARHRSRRIRAGLVGLNATLPPVTVLKPLHGDDPLLETALTSIATQDYPAMQVVFGVQDRDDAAIAVARRVIAAHPDRDITLVIDETRHPGNGKIGNLINMLPAARHELLVISDADIHTRPDYLTAVAASLTTPGVGLVTTVYHGLPARNGFAERLASAQITHNFLPGSLLGRWMGREDCLGATMALSRETLARVGGLESLLPHVADDGVLGRRVRALGLRVALAPSMVATTVADSSLADMISHELRWGRTVRTQEPLGYGLSSLQLPLAWATLAMALQPGHICFLRWFLAIWLIRGLTSAITDRLAGAPHTVPFWALPLRDWISAGVMVGSFTSRRVAWRGQTFHIEPRGSTDRPADETRLSPAVAPLLGAGLPAGLSQRQPALTTQTRSPALPTRSMRKTPV